MLLAVDSWIDSSLYEGGFRLREFWEGLTIFFRRFRVSGWRRGLNELMSEAFTMGAAGSVVMLALALPAFEETSGNWRQQDDFARIPANRLAHKLDRLAARECLVVLPAR